MKKKTDDDFNIELLPEYDLDFEEASANPYAGKVARSQIMVSIDEDVARFFKSSKQVNKALRSLLQAIPEEAIRQSLMGEVLPETIPDDGIKKHPGAKRSDRADKPTRTGKK
ncbi:MAG: hypothetical protein NUW37_19485 [Planctomycetes bacterium]|nr:hypothetical protein [Planctomycetota bacterium]